MVVACYDHKSNRGLMIFKELSEKRNCQNFKVLYIKVPIVRCGRFLTMWSQNSSKDFIHPNLWCFTSLRYSSCTCKCSAKFCYGSRLLLVRQVCLRQQQTTWSKDFQQVLSDLVIWLWQTTIACSSEVSPEMPGPKNNGKITALKEC